MGAQVARPVARRLRGAAARYRADDVVALDEVVELGRGRSPRQALAPRDAPLPVAPMGRWGRLSEKRQLGPGTPSTRPGSSQLGSASSSPQLPAEDLEVEDCDLDEFDLQLDRAVKAAPSASAAPPPPRYFPQGPRRVRAATEPANRPGSPVDLFALLERPATPMFDVLCQMPGAADLGCDDQLGLEREEVAVLNALLRTVRDLRAAARKVHLPPGAAQRVERLLGREERGLKAVLQGRATASSEQVEQALRSLADEVEAAAQEALRKRGLAHEARSEFTRAVAAHRLRVAALARRDGDDCKEQYEAGCARLAEQCAAKLEAAGQDRAVPPVATAWAPLDAQGPAQRSAGPAPARRFVPAQR